MTPTTAPQKRSGPDAQARTEAGNFHDRIRQSTALDTYRALAGQPSSRPIEALLGRLENARQRGRGYRADCPVGHSSRGALSIAEGDDGRVLLTCFAGCAAADVLGAVGLTLADLYPERVRDLSPLGRAQRREAMHGADVAAASTVLSFEASIIAVAAADIGRGTPLAIEDCDRLARAVDCIEGARSILDGKPVDERHYQRVVAALHRGAEDAAADRNRTAARRTGVAT